MMETIINQAVYVGRSPQSWITGMMTLCRLLGDNLIHLLFVLDPHIEFIYPWESWNNERLDDTSLKRRTERDLSAVMLIGQTCLVMPPCQLFPSRSVASHLVSTCHSPLPFPFPLLFVSLILMLLLLTGSHHFPWPRERHRTRAES